MLPTLNLQLTTVEPLDDTHSATLQPSAGAAGAGETGFADVLRLRVDSSAVMENAAGEFLPQGGSELPVLTDFAPADLANDLLPAMSITSEFVVPQPEPVTESTGAAESPDLVLQAPVLYPPLEGPVQTTSAALIASAPGTSGPTATSILPLTAANPVSVESAVPADQTIRIDSAGRPGAESTTALQATVTSHAAGAREANPLASAGDRGAPLPAGFVSREPGQFRETGGRAAAIALTRPGADGLERLPPADPNRQAEHAGLQRDDRGPVLTADTLQSRVSAQQLAQLPQTQSNLQVLQAQPNVQNSQAQPGVQFAPAQLIPAAPSAAVAPDVAYAGGTLQSSDLIGTPVRDSAWGSQLGERVVMMAGNQLKSAEIRLTPAELGPLRVQVAVDDGAAHVTFHAQHAVTRDAIEQALPRLREMLAENGLSLGQADVSDRGVGEGDRDAGERDSVSNLVSEASEETNVGADREPQVRTTISNGLVDTFA